MLLQLAVLARGLGGLPSQPVSVPPAAHVLTDRQIGSEMRKPTEPKLFYCPDSLRPIVLTFNTHMKGSQSGAILGSLAISIPPLTLPPLCALTLPSLL